jgi:hypothetical protein
MARRDVRIGDGNLEKSGGLEGRKILPENQITANFQYYVANPLRTYLWSWIILSTVLNSVNGVRIAAKLWHFRFSLIKITSDKLPEKQLTVLSCIQYTGCT